MIASNGILKCPIDSMYSEESLAPNRNTNRRPRRLYLGLMINSHVRLIAPNINIKAVNRYKVLEKLIEYSFAANRVALTRISISIYGCHIYLYCLSLVIILHF